MNLSADHPHRKFTLKEMCTQLRKHIPDLEDSLVTEAFMHLVTNGRLPEGVSRVVRDRVMARIDKLHANRSAIIS